MSNERIINVLVIMIMILSAFVAYQGIFSTGGPGKYEFQSIRGTQVKIHGIGLYKDMSAEVAPQGIAQDVVTLFIAIPFMLVTLVLTNKKSLKARVLLTGLLAYFLVTYLFYLAMAMYHQFYIIYVMILGMSFIAFIMNVVLLNPTEFYKRYSDRLPNKRLGLFLMFNSMIIALLWLNIILRPLFDGTLIPKETEHYTTLIVQGFDLSLLLPMGFISGYLLFKKRAFGYLFSHLYFIFLSVLMSALIAKIVAMGMLGYPIIPVIFIIPVINIGAITCSGLMFKHLK